MVFRGQAILVDAEKFLLEEEFLDPVMVIQAGLSAPAVVEHGEHMGLGPFQVGRVFLPVIDVFKFVAFHRSAGDDESVIAAVLDIIEVQVGRIQVGRVRVGRFVGDRAAEIDLDLDGGVPEQAQQLQFRRLFQRHEVQDQDLQRTDILRGGTVFRNGDDSLFAEVLDGR